MGPALTFPIVSVIYLPCRRGRIHCISSLGNPDHWERKGLITGLERWPLPSILKAQKQNTLSFLLSISLGTAEFSGPSISRSLTRCSVLFAFTSLLAIWMPYNYICKHVFLIMLHVMYFFCNLLCTQHVSSVFVAQEDSAQWSVRGCSPEWGD